MRPAQDFSVLALLLPHDTALRAERREADRRRGAAPGRDRSRSATKGCCRCSTQGQGGGQALDVHPVGVARAEQGGASISRSRRSQRAWRFSSSNHPDRASDQWMWTPALQRERRIALQDRSTRFFGTDFSFEDLEERDVNQYDYRLLGEEVIDGAACWRIESMPAEKKTSQYTKSEVWIRKDTYALAQVESYIKADSRAPPEVQRFRAACRASGPGGGMEMTRSAAQEPHDADARETRVQHAAEGRGFHAAGACGIPM